MPDYLELTYSDARLPPSAYPERLTDWIISQVFQQPGTLVDVGCGRGEYLRSFQARGFDVIGVDRAPSARGAGSELRVEITDIEHEAMPLLDRSVDYVYSKSVIEHLHKPDHFLTECFRVLKPGGKAVIMTPSWRHIWKVFYEDYTHVTPFTANGLADAMSVAGFVDVSVVPFWQLPFLWNHPWLCIPVRLLALLPLPYRPWDRAPWPEGMNKLIRFSKEAMLFGVGRRPAGEISG
jgi:SAM-dependent methyltransferase